MIHEELWRILLDKDPYELSKCSLADYDEEIKGYRLKILGKSYLIQPNEQVIQELDKPQSHLPGFHLQLSAVNYLIGAKEIPLSNNWVSEKQFPSGPMFFRGPHEMPIRKLEQAFSKDADGFFSACESVEGKKVKGGDIAFELPVFPRLPARVFLWLADEEFPARISFLFDRTANLHLKLDAIWSVGKLIEEVLLEKSEI